ncbi:hypothetical protein ABZ419_11375 [Streptomyces cinnamoneus]|uniref:hypothetical protein n=1 Tax=Streptomyces cinnamoneus TaxID=53446 RepID=UPI0033E468E1
MSKPVYYLAEYEGARPALFRTAKAAMAHCDDFLRAETAERPTPPYWDWIETEDGDWQQVWTRDLDDAPTGEAPGLVTALPLE